LDLVYREEVELSALRIPVAVDLVSEKPAKPLRLRSSYSVATSRSRPRPSASASRARA